MSGQYLVLLDMNGTVCYRNEFPVPVVRSDLYIRRKHFYRRIGIDNFVSKLVNSGHFQVAVYTSMMAHNVEAGLNAVLRNRNQLVAILDRDMNKPDPDGENHWDTIRDMNKVWQKMTGYGPTNTILLDNEARKFQETPGNGIVVPEFGAAEVQARTNNTLDHLLRYLLKLGEAQPADVRTYLRQHPFSRAPVAAYSDEEEEDGGDDGGDGGLAATLSRLFLATPKAAASTTGSRGSTSLTAAAGSGTTSSTTATASPGTYVPRSNIAVYRAASAAKASGAASSSANDTKREGEDEQEGTPMSPNQVLEEVPAGTRLVFTCVDGGRFVLCGEYAVYTDDKVFVCRRKLTVRGPAGNPKLRIDYKMDAHRLVEEAKECGVTLTVMREDV